MRKTASRRVSGVSQRSTQSVRSSASTSVPETVNEKILRSVYALYHDKERGLVQMAQELGLKMTPPQRKVNIMLIGNHSAGKSSFINWYLGEHVQKTGVAIETQGFSIVTHGRRRETLRGPATFTLYPHLSPLADFPGVIENVSTEICTSSERRFNLISFIDTPGLVDGSLAYAFNVNEVICWLAQHVDLVFVFFDPIGQALCARTMQIVEQLNVAHSDKMRFYLSKADEVPNETDRQKVLIQITQNLSHRIRNKNFDLPTIFVPAAGRAAPLINHIEGVCGEIDRAVQLNVQNGLNMLVHDSERIKQAMTKAVAQDRQHAAANRRALVQGVALSVAAVLCPLLLLVYLVLSFDWLRSMTFLQSPGIAPYLAMMHARLPRYSLDHVTGVLLALCVLCAWLARRVWVWQPRLKHDTLRRFRRWSLTIDSSVLPARTQLYDEYLRQSVAYGLDDELDEIHDLPEPRGSSYEDGDGDDDNDDDDDGAGDGNGHSHWSDDDDFSSSSNGRGN